MVKISSIKINKEIWGFSFYDFANSAYLLIFGTLLFPIFFKETLLNGESNGDFYWGLLISSSVFLAVIAGPFIGYLSDVYNRWKLFFLNIILVFLGATAVSFLVGFGSITPLVIGITFILTHSLYILSITLYDSYISHISDQNNSGLISAFSWGFGYIGGSSCFILIFLLAGKDISPSFQSFLITSIFYLLFSVVSLALLPKVTSNNQSKILRFPFKELVHKKNIILLLSFWLINESIVTITFFVALFGRGTLHLEISTIGILFLSVQLIAFPATWFMGYLSKKYNKNVIIKLTIIIWAIVLIGLSVSYNLAHLVILSIISAFVIGSTQALMRAYYSDIHNKYISGSAFGIYSIITRTSAIAGPLLFGLMSKIFQSQRLAILTMLAPLIIGYFLFNSYAKNRSLDVPDQNK